MEKKKPVVLVVEDDIDKYQSEWEWELCYRIEFLYARTIEEARRLYRERKDIQAIAVDACVPGDNPNTMELVREIRKEFKGTIVAISSLREYRALLREAGCSQECEKQYLPEMLAHLFPRP